MAGHVECSVVVRAPLALTWALAGAHPGGAPAVVAADPARHALTLRVTTPPDLDGRVWTYDVERVADPERRTVFARRFGHAHLAYAHAWWSFRDVANGTEIRCVQDFETAAGAPVDDRRMTEILRHGTEAALRRHAAAVEAAAGC